MQGNGDGVEIEWCGGMEWGFNVMEHNVMEEWRNGMEMEWGNGMEVEESIEWRNERSSLHLSSA